jgi:hypothetical protein
MRILVIIFSLLIITARGQKYIDYFNQSNEAEYLLSQGNYDGARGIYSKMEKKFKRLKPKDDWYMGLMNYFQKDSANGAKYMVKCAEHLGWPQAMLLEFQKKYPQLNISNSTLKEVEKIEKEKTAQKKKSVSDTLKYFTDQDQNNRRNLAAIDSAGDLKLQKLMLKYFKDNGIPDMLLYGDNFAVVFLHITNQELLKEYKELLMKQVKKGNVYPWYYTSMVDRDMEARTGTSMYNSFAYKKGYSKEDIEKFNKNRKEIGLSVYFKGSSGMQPIRNFSSGYIKITDQ